MRVFLFMSPPKIYILSTTPQHWGLYAVYEYAAGVPGPSVTAYPSSSAIMLPLITANMTKHRILLCFFADTFLISLPQTISLPPFYFHFLPLYPR